MTDKLHKHKMHIYDMAPPVKHNRYNYEYKQHKHNKMDDDSMGNGRYNDADTDAFTFRVPISFYQELAETPDGLVPLSRISRNMNNVKGFLKLRFKKDLSRAAYKLYVFNATATQDRIISAHLHDGRAFENGPIIVTLFNGPAINVDGLLSRGYIDNSNITSVNGQNMEINTLASLYQSIRDGNIYANVHSERYPAGIIRGQIF